MGQFIDLKDAEKKARRAIEDRIEDWYDLRSYEEPIIETSDIDQIGDTPIFILEGYIDVDFKSGWLSSEEGRVLFTVKLDAESGKVLSIKHEVDEEEED